MKCGHQQFNLSSTDPENVVTNTKARLVRSGSVWIGLDGCRIKERSDGASHEGLAFSGLRRDLRSPACLQDS